MDPISKKVDVLAYLWPLLFWKVLYLKPILLKYEQNSHFILLTLYIFFSLAFIFGFLFNYFKVTLNKGYLVLHLMIIVFLVNTIIKPNPTIFNYFYRFLSEPFLMALFLLSVKDYRALLRNYSFLAVITVIIYGFLPAFGINIFKDYMDFGFSISMPGFFGIYIARKYFHKKWLIPLEIICWFMLLIFSNRTAILAAIFLVVIYNISVEKKNIKDFFYWFILILLAIIVLNFFLPKIFLFLQKIAYLIGYNSYALNKLSSWLINDDTSKLISGRDIIYKDALEQIKNNIIFGSGIGSFETIYAHNFILDFLLDWGIFGLVGLFILLIKSLKVFFKETGPKKVVLILLFCMWFPKLFFSSSFLYNAGFWGFITLIFTNNFRKERDNEI